MTKLSLSPRETSARISTVDDPRIDAEIYSEAIETAVELEGAGFDSERLRAQVIAGTPEQVAERILEYGEVLGAEGTYVARAHFPGLDPAVAAESRRVFAEEVLPLVRS